LQFRFAILRRDNGVEGGKSSGVMMSASENHLAWMATIDT